MNLRSFELLERFLIFNTHFSFWLLNCSQIVHCPFSFDVSLHFGFSNMPLHFYSTFFFCVIHSRSLLYMYMLNLLSLLTLYRMHKIFHQCSRMYFESNEQQSYTCKMWFCNHCDRILGILLDLLMKFQCCAGNVYILLPKIVIAIKDSTKSNRNNVVKRKSNKSHIPTVGSTSSSLSLSLSLDLADIEYARWVCVCVWTTEYATNITFYISIYNLHTIYITFVDSTKKRIWKSNTWFQPLACNGKPLDMMQFIYYSPV